MLSSAAGVLSVASSCRKESGTIVAPPTTNAGVSVSVPTEADVMACLFVVRKMKIMLVQMKWT